MEALAPGSIADGRNSLQRTVIPLNASFPLNVSLNAVLVWRCSAPSWHLDLAVLTIYRQEAGSSVSSAITKGSSSTVTQTVWFVGRRWLSPTDGLEVRACTALTRHHRLAGPWAPGVSCHIKRPHMT
jgi:hypothetical protein